jgi:transposase InsO family protein
MSDRKPPKIPLPKGWTAHVRSAVLYVISLAQYATVQTRSWAANSVNVRIRSKGKNDRLRQELALLQEECRIKDSRMARIRAQHRPHFRPTERMAILELRAARGWSLRQAARVFLVSQVTLASWMKRLDEAGPDALVQMTEPVNRFPDFVRYLVQRLRVLCPSMGKVKIAQVLARAGLHLGSTTVGRILREPPRPAPVEAKSAGGRSVKSKHPNHVWNVDLTTVPTSAGFWTAWMPLALPQRWPFCWWVAAVVDHHSRRALGFAVFNSQPSSAEVSSLLDSTIHQLEAKPKHLITDQGGQFTADDFKDWGKRRGIQHRYGAVDKHGALAIIEWFNLTLKDECTRRVLVPLCLDGFWRELLLFVDWYNQHRPNMAFDGRTPDEDYFDREPANELPRYEPRSGWPRGSPYAGPLAPTEGEPGVRITLDLRFYAGRKHLPIVALKQAA